MIHQIFSLLKAVIWAGLTLQGCWHITSLIHTHRAKKTFEGHTISRDQFRIKSIHPKKGGCTLSRTFQGKQSDTLTRTNFSESSPAWTVLSAGIARNVHHRTWFAGHPVRTRQVRVREVALLLSHWFQNRAVPHSSPTVRGRLIFIRPCQGGPFFRGSLALMCFYYFLSLDCVRNFHCRAIWDNSTFFF